MFDLKKVSCDLNFSIVSITIQNAFEFGIGQRPCFLGRQEIEIKKRRKAQGARRRL